MGKVIHVRGLRNRKIPLLTKMDFSDRFRTLVDGCGLNQAALASQLGISDSSLSNYKQGRTPKAEELLRISEYFGVSMEWLLTGHERGKLGEPAGGYGPRVQSEQMRKTVEEIEQRLTDLQVDVKKLSKMIPPK